VVVFPLAGVPALAFAVMPAALADVSVGVALVAVGAVRRAVSAWLHRPAALAAFVVLGPAGVRVADVPRPAAYVGLHFAAGVAARVVRFGDEPSVGATRWRLLEVRSQDGWDSEPVCFEDDYWLQRARAADCHCFRLEFWSERCESVRAWPAGRP